ncbi:hypothetical protein HKX48_008541 [Thoreauomyces humboldtii]|nr:hypothetical protein HKX48_008541 [Thoreauomyces humboldtii]
MSSVVTSPVKLTFTPVRTGQLGTTAHRIYVTRLYRRALRLSADWHWQRTEMREKNLIIREMFDANKHLNNPREIEQVLGRTEWELAVNYHPQPYYTRLGAVAEMGGPCILTNSLLFCFPDPTAPGGSKWERNIPFPEELIKRGVTPFDNCN